jgi:hypothetical protein
VHDARVVRDREGTGDLDQDVDPLLGRDAGVADQRAQAPALDQLHHHVRRAVVLADVVDRNDVRVIELGHRAGLAHQPGPGLLLFGPLVQHLERDPAIEPLVVGAEDAAHPPLADRILDPVALDRVPRLDHAQLAAPTPRSLGGAVHHTNGTKSA